MIEAVESTLLSMQGRNEAAFNLAAVAAGWLVGEGFLVQLLFWDNSLAELLLPDL